VMDTMVFGYFKMYNWWFIVNQDVDIPEGFRVSEASTGCQLNQSCYDEIEYCLECSLKFINEKKLFLATIIGNTLVEHQENLLRRNLAPFSETLSII